MGVHFTDCDRRVWEYVYWCYDGGQGSPSVREIAAAVMYSNGRVTESLLKLEVRGVLRCHYLVDGRRAARGILWVAPPDGAKASSPPVIEGV